MPWSRGGTVAVTQNSTTVTGAGTGFVANGRVGDAFLGPDGRWYEVTNIASDTALSILPAYLGATANGVYALAPMQGYVKQSADALRTLVNQFGGVLAVLGSEGTQSGVRQSLGLGAVATENVVPVARGGTGATSQAAACDGIGALKAGTTQGSSGFGLSYGGHPSIASITSHASGPLSVTNNGNGGASAVLTFFREGVFGCHLGLDTDNVFKVGGWSMGGAYKLYHEGNTIRAADGTLKAI